MDAEGNPIPTGSGISLAFTSESQAPDPVVRDFPVAFIKRNLVLDDMGTRIGTRQRELIVFEPGAALVLKERATPSAAETNITDRAFTPEEGGDTALYDVRDLETDFDGSRLVFSMRGPFDPDADEDEQPSWNIWLYDVANDELTRVISSDTIAEAGHDRDPHFLPDGRIVFTSTRQRTARAILLDEGRPQFAAMDEDRREPAFVLHTMEADGSSIEQITFNQSHDQDPVVLQDGRITFVRWDNVPGRDVLSLYRANPDGSSLERLYGYHSGNTGPGGTAIVFSEPRETEDGRVLALVRPDGDRGIGADLFTIDVDNYVEFDQPTFGNSGQLAEGQEPTLDEPVLFDAPSPRGEFAFAYPLYDGTDRLLVSWSQCRLLAADAAGEDRIVPCTEEALTDAETAPRPADALYGLWILDPAADTQQPVVPPTEGVAFTEGVVLSERTTPWYIAPPVLDAEGQDLADEAAGILHIRSVYDLDGTDGTVDGYATTANPVLTPLADRPAVFLRLAKPVSLPDDDLVDLPGTAFGRSRNQLMREIVGYAPVHPDGSVYVKVPANIPFTLSLLDANGRRVSPRHANWLQVRPGEIRTCNGCHTDDSTLPHGRLDADAPALNDGGPFAGLNPDFLVEPGETMAEAWARANGVPAPAFDLEFDDPWTDPAERTPDAAFAMRYQDLSSAAPVSTACATSWQASCRVTINYEEFIHPLWAVDRREFEADGVTVAVDRTCTACHAPTDDMDAAMVPAAQLDLTDGPSTDQPDHFKSYRELFFGDNEQEVVDNVLIDRLVPVLDGNGDPVFEVDIDGELILDAEDNPIPVLQTVGVSPSLSVNGALSSSRFFDRFAAGGTHAGSLTAAELRLFAEWLDLGGQYYNNPFDVPQD